MTDQQSTINEFTAAFRGKFVNLLSWDDFDNFWDLLLDTSSNGWYVYQLDEQPPQQTLPSESFVRFSQRLRAKLKREHKEDYCGIVYVDDKQSPSFIKIYDPKNLGVVCGFSDNPPLPGWVFSKIKPVDKSVFVKSKPKQSHWKQWLNFNFK